MIALAKGAQREVEDVALTRYACYLIRTKRRSGFIRRLQQQRYEKKVRYSGSKTIS
jgi:hypothetical protein